MCNFLKLDSNISVCGNLTNFIFDVGPLYSGDPDFDYFQALNFRYSDSHCITDTHHSDQPRAH